MVNVYFYGLQNKTVRGQNIYTLVFFFFFENFSILPKRIWITTTKRKSRVSFARRWLMSQSIYVYIYTTVEGSLFSMRGSQVTQTLSNSLWEVVQQFEFKSRTRNESVTNDWSWKTCKSLGCMNVFKIARVREKYVCI